MVNRRRTLLLFVLIVVVSIVASACTTEPFDATTTTTRPELEAVSQQLIVGQAVPPATSAALRNQLGYEFPPAPAVTEGPASEELAGLLDLVFAGIAAGAPVDGDTIRAIGDTGDARAAWLLTDLLQFIGPSDARNASIEAYTALVGRTADDPVSKRSTWQSAVDHLIAWDLPALDAHEEWKGMLYTAVDPRWTPFFEDPDADIDWRHIGWGGVFIDDRPLGTETGCPGGCIPALDDPAVTGVDGGDWYPDDAIVFGVSVGGESRAYPKNIMEVHEMVNDTLGGRRLGIPYCTLCGSAQAYFTDDVPDGVETPVLRTSGLLTRSNKVMYDLNTFSVLNTFTGEAVSGPLREAGLVLNQTTVVTSTWADWKAAHPDTTIVARDGGVGRSYNADPLRGRDDNGPIFPIGDVDERLEAQVKVFGVFDSDGNAIAFPVDAVREVLDAGNRVILNGVEVVADGSGVRAIDSSGNEVVGHEAFWFAWSQFHPDTTLWSS